AVREPAAFAQALRHASEILTTATTNDDATLAAGLEQAVTQLGALSFRPPERPAPAPTPATLEAPESTFATFLKEVTDAVEPPPARPPRPPTRAGPRPRPRGRPPRPPRLHRRRHRLPPRNRSRHPRPGRRACGSCARRDR